MMCVHRVVPTRYGGDPVNGALMLLCPPHASIARGISMFWRRGRGHIARPDTVKAVLALIDDEPDCWLKLFDEGLKGDMSLLLDRKPNRPPRTR
jgi:hypothetical protein